LNYQPDSAISYFNKFIEQSGKKTLFTWNGISRH
jgi:hypothetical protein